MCLMKSALLPHWHFMVKFFQDLKGILEVISKEAMILSRKIIEAIFKRRK